MQHWGDGDNVVASQEDLKQAPLALLCISLPPKLVDLLLDHHKLLLPLTYGGQPMNGDRTWFVPSGVVSL